jgi:tetratricopeptide (TPR) repeat protein
MSNPKQSDRKRLSAARSSKGSRRLNASVFLKTLLLLAVFGGATWGLHRLQFGRIVSNLESEAKEKLQSKDYESATELLERLIALEPQRNREIVELADAHSHKYTGSVASLPQIVDRQISYDTAALTAISLDPSLADRSLAIKKRMVEKNLQSLRLETAYRLLASMAGQEPDTWIKKQAAMVMLASRISGGSPPALPQGQTPTWFAKLQERHPVDLLLECHASNPSDVEVASTLVNIVAGLGSKAILEGSAWAEFSPAALQAEIDRIVDVLVDSTPGEAALILRASMKTRSPKQRSQDLEKVLEVSPDRLEALQELVRIQIDMRRSPSDDADLLMETQAVDSMMDRIEKLSPSDRSEYVLLKGLWISQSQGTEQAIAYWESQVSQLDRPIAVLNAMLEVALEQKNRILAKEILRRMRESIEAQQKVESQADIQQSNWILAGAEARIAYEDGNIERATRFLESSGIQGSLEQRKVQWMRMAEGYRQMGLNEKALDAMQRAAQVDPSDIQVRRSLADQMAKLGRLPDAINTLNGIDPKAPQDELALAGFLLQAASQTESDLVDWTLFKQSCSRARSLNSQTPGGIEAWRIDLLELAANWIRKQRNSGRLGEDLVLSQAKKISAANADSLDCQEALINSLTQWVPNADIDFFIEQIAAIDTDHPRVMIHRFNEALQAGRSEAVADLEKAYLENPDDRIRNRLILHAASREMWDEVDRYVSMNSAETPIREDELLRICELLLANPPKASTASGTVALDSRRRQWLDLIAKYDQMLERMDSDFGFNWRLIRLQRFFESGTLQAADAKEVTDLLAQIEELRPGWDGLFALRGRLAEMRGDSQRAIDAYSIAWNRNMLSNNLTSRYLALLNKEDRQADLKKVLEKISETGRAGTLGKGSVEANIESNADQMIENMIRLSPSDPMGYLIKYRVMLARAARLKGTERIKQEQAAEAELASASRIAADTSPLVFSEEIQRAHAVGKKEVVFSLQDRVMAATSIPMATRLSLIGDSKLLLGNLSEAIQAFQQSIEAGGSRLELTLKIADCAAISGDTQLALSSYRKLAVDYPNNLTFKTRLTQYLGFLNLPETWNEARKVLGVADAGTSDTSKYQFALLVLGYGDGELVDEAIQLLESTSFASNPESSVQIVLGRLLIHKAKQMFLEGEQSEDIEKVYLLAADRILNSRNQDAKAVQAAGFLFSSLMAEKRYAAAESVSNRMGRIPGASADVIACQSRLTVAKENNSGRVPFLIDEFLKTLPEVPQTASELREATLLGRTHLLVGDAAKGEKILRGIAERVPGNLALYAIATGAVQNPATQMVAREYLASLLEKSSGDEEWGAMTLFLSRSDQFENEIPGILEAWNKSDSNRQGPGSIRMRLAVASLLSTKGRTEEASAIVEDCRRINPLDPLLVNNHAMILAELDGRATEALELASRYVPDDFFDITEWQDTLGYTRLASGQAKAAVDVLKSAFTRSNSPRIALHLATALLEAGDQTSAARVSRGIVERELRLELLSPSERAAWERLKKLSPDDHL